MKTTTTKALLVLAGFAVITPFAQAQTPSYTNGDLFLGFRASGGTGATQTYLVNIGQAATYRDAAEGSSFSLSIGNIGADLTATYGATWFDRADLFWGIVGGISPTAVAGDNPNTLYASLEQQPFGIVSNPWDRRSGSQQGSTNTQISGLKNSFVSGNYSVTVNSSVAAIIPTADANSWEDFNDGALSFGAWNGGIEGSFDNGTEGSALDLHRMATSPTPGLDGTYEGTFTINDAGSVSFAAPVPEPSSALIIASGFGVLGMLRRRKRPSIPNRLNPINLSV